MIRNQQVRSSSLLAGSRFQGVRMQVLAPFSFFRCPCLLAPLADPIYPQSPLSPFSQHFPSRADFYEFMFEFSMLDEFEGF